MSNVRPQPYKTTEIMDEVDNLVEHFESLGSEVVVHNKGYSGHLCNIVVKDLDHSLLKTAPAVVYPVTLDLEYTEIPVYGNDIVFLGNVRLFYKNMQFTTLGGMTTGSVLEGINKCHYLESLGDIISRYPDHRNILVQGVSHNLKVDSNELTNLHMVSLVYSLNTDVDKVDLSYINKPYNPFNLSVLYVKLPFKYKMGKSCSVVLDGSKSLIDTSEYIENINPLSREYLEQYDDLGNFRKYVKDPIVVRRMEEEGITVELLFSSVNAVIRVV